MKEMVVAFARQPRVVLATTVLTLLSFLANRRFALAARTLGWLAAFAELVKTNQLMMGLLVPTGVGMILYQLRSIANTIKDEIRSMFWCTIQVKNSDKSFAAVLAQIAELNESETNLVCTTNKKKGKNVGWRQRFIQGMSGVKEAPEVAYEPAQSSRLQFINYKGKRIMVTRAKGDTITTGYSRQPLELETIHLSAWASSCDLIKEFIASAVQKEFHESNKGIGIYALSSMSWYGGWERVLTKDKRDRSSVVLADKLSDDLIADARKFLDSHEWYRDRGIPYRRGYLLYGPPGSGKTSFVQVLAGELNLDICMLSLSNEGLTDESLATNLRDAPADAVVLLEDVDAVFVESRQAGPGADSANKRKSSGGVSFSGLLNAIDGVASQEGRMLFMTTNFPSRLDDALVRPGRCDVKLCLDYATHDQVRKLAGLFYADAPAPLVEEFVQLLPNKEISMAQLQGHFVRHRDSLSAAIRHANALLKSNTSNKKVVSQSLFQLLQSVGLHALLPCFAWSGLTRPEDAFELKVEVVQAWCPQLVYFPKVLARLERFLKGLDDMAFMKTCRDRADQALAKKLFLEAYAPAAAVFGGVDGVSAGPGADNGDDGADNGDDSDGGGGTRVGGGGGGMDLDALAREFVRAVSDAHGKIFLSRWQLRRVLALFPHQPTRVVGNLGFVSQPGWSSDLAIAPLPVFDWLKRCGGGLQVHAGALEKRARVKTFEDFVKAGWPNKDADALCKACASKLPKPAAEFLVKVSSFKSLGNADAQLVSGVVLPDRGEVFLLVLEQYFCGALTRRSIAFATMFTDAVVVVPPKGPAGKKADKHETKQTQDAAAGSGGNGGGGGSKEDDGDGGEAAAAARLGTEAGSILSVASRAQLHAFFKKFPRAVQVTPAVVAAELVNVRRAYDKPDPPKPRSMTWIARLLRLHGLGSYAPKFEGAGLATRAAVLAEPLLEDLADLGVAKAGHERYLTALFKRLSGDAEEGVAPEDDGLAKRGSKVVMRLGGLCGVPGVVRAFRGPKAAFGREAVAAAAAEKAAAAAAAARGVTAAGAPEKPRDGLFEVELSGWRLADGGCPVVSCVEEAFDVVPPPATPAPPTTATTGAVTSAAAVAAAERKQTANLAAERQGGDDDIITAARRKGGRTAEESKRGGTPAAGMPTVGKAPGGGAVELVTPAAEAETDQKD